METYSNFDVYTQQNTSGCNKNILLLAWSHIRFVLKRFATDVDETGVIQKPSSQLCLLPDTTDVKTG